MGSESESYEENRARFNGILRELNKSHLEYELIVNDQNYKLGITNFHWESETKVVCNLYIDKIITNKNKKRKQIFNRNSVVLLTDFEYNYSAFKNSFMESVSSNIMNRIWKPDSKKLREKVGLSDENFDELLNPLYENITTKILGCYANLEND